MSGELRDRVAAVLAREFARLWDLDAPPPGFDVDCRPLADAVLDELGLRPVEAVDRRYLRYCTKWTNNPDWKKPG